MTILSNVYKEKEGEYERIDIEIAGLYSGIPTRAFLAGCVMREDRPKESEIKKVRTIVEKGKVVYELLIIRDHD